MPSIRRATLADAEALVELSTATFTETFGHLYDPADLETCLADHQKSGLGSTLIELVLDWIGPRTA
ncbi:N-acetyltransferase [Corynebacterium diphtheriae]|nr:N-acetyltransferase [Corynebacterium diphtheriae]